MRGIANLEKKCI
uniref:Uncharacterized protein n=1 Tax=Arundo donax TaxID=35708 RepID=A0A0A8XZ51_ARUDO